MNREYFNQEITQILEDGKVENITINNCETIKKIILDDAINIPLFKNFKLNYESTFDDLDSFVLKVQDLVYRLNIFVNNILIENGIKKEDELYDTILHCVTEDTIDFYSAVSYNEDDIFVMKDEYESEVFNIK